MVQKIVLITGLGSWHTILGLHFILITYSFLQQSLVFFLSCPLLYPKHSILFKVCTFVYSICLKNPRDGGAWWAAVCGVAQSRTRLKRLSCSSSSSCLMEYYFEFLKKNFVQIILYYRLSLFWGFSHFLKGRNMLTSIQFMNAFLIRCFWLLHGIS